MGSAKGFEIQKTSFAVDSVPIQLLYQYSEISRPHSRRLVPLRLSYQYNEISRPTPEDLYPYNCCTGMATLPVSVNVNVSRDHLPKEISPGTF